MNSGLNCIEILSDIVEPEEPIEKDNIIIIRSFITMIVSLLLIF